MSDMLNDAKQDVPLSDKGTIDVSKQLVFASVGLTAFQKDVVGLFEKEKLRGLHQLFSTDQLAGRDGHISGWIARRLAHLLSKGYWSVEVGFLTGFSPQISEPPHSYVISKIENLDQSGPRRGYQSMLVEQCPPAEKPKIMELMSTIKVNKLSKYNHRPVVSAEQSKIPALKPYLIVADQPFNSILPFKQRSTLHAARKMLDFAQGLANGRTIVICSDSASTKQGPIARLALDMRLNVVFAPKVNNWPLIEGADAILTLGSQIGLEALIANKPVHVFEDCFFAGHGITSDHFDEQKQSTGKNVVDLFYSAYCLNSRYLDLHTREQCTLETSIDQAICVRDQRMRLGKRVVTSGFSPWKRLATQALLVSSDGKARHRRFFKSAQQLAKRSASNVAVWGMKYEMEANYFVEDGFIRSKGLGVKLTFPSSLAIDRLRPHYDCRGPSELENILQSKAFEPKLIERANQLKIALIKRDISKYNIKQSLDLPVTAPGVLRILVPGQVATDQSILLGAPALNSNYELVECVRKLFPSAFIVYKVHPDVTTGHRSGGKEPVQQNLTATSGSITEWIAWADRIETITSLAGFEALIRGKTVGVHGIPFYAGWGLTEDRTAIARRTRKLKLDELIAGALIEYPFYVHTHSRMPCHVEDLIKVLAEK